MRQREKMPSRALDAAVKNAKSSGNARISVLLAIRAFCSSEKGAVRTDNRVTHWRTVSTRVQGHLFLIFFCILLSGCRSRPGRSEPTIEFTKVPAARVGGPDKLDTIEGRATGIRAGQQIVLYAKGGGVWWVQPFTVNPYTEIQADSRWKSSTHLGTDYAALLVEPGYAPPETAATLPPLGAGVVTVAIAEATVPAWETSWFRLSIVALLGLMALTVFRLRHLRQVRQMNMRFEERLAERTRIARDLHDTLLQSFHGLMLRLQLVEDLLPEGKAKTQLEQTLRRADQAIAEGRRALYDLRSSTAAPTDLSQAVRSLGDEFATENSAAFHLVVEGAARDLNPVIRDELYLITREALQNAFCHARAHRIEAEIIYGRGAFRLRIRDDGEGIPTQIMEEGRPGHYGLSGMRERARQIGGKLDLWSRAGAGTEVQLSIPGSAAYRRSVARSLFSLLRKKRGDP